MQTHTLKTTFVCKNLCCTHFLSYFQNTICVIFNDKVHFFNNWKINTVFITAIVITQDIPIDIAQISEDLVQSLHDKGQNAFAIHCFEKCDFG